MKSLPEVVADTPHRLADCCRHLADCEAVGLDTEFVGEHSYHPDLCLVQVSTPERLYLIDPLSAGPLDAFWALIADPTRTTIVHAGREELRMCELGCGRPPGRLVDLQLAAGLLGMGYPIGHAALVGRVLKAKVSKGETLTDWRKRPLSPQQIRYAYDDVRYLLPLWDRLRKQLTRLNRLDWLTEECGTLTGRASVENPGVERWRKLKGVSSLDARRSAVARELFLWRDGVAAEKNRPARTILRDDLIVEIARKMPRSAEDFRDLRGLPRVDPAVILAAVERGRAVAVDDLPEPPERDHDPPQAAWVSAVVLAVLGDLCQRWALTPALVTTNADVKAMVRARLAGDPLPPVALTRGWRAAHVLPDLVAVLDGRRALRIADVRSPTPFAYADRPISRG